MSSAQCVDRSETDYICSTALAHNIANQHQGADAIWNRVLAATTAISSSVGGLAQSNDDDDTSLDADGNTKLTRVIKQ